MSMDAETLYGLLPQICRTRDTSGALKALVSVLAEQAEMLEEDLSRLYDNHFIETCEEWAVPYIGALVGARGLSAVPTEVARHRDEVANTLRLRRRKGTAAVLEQLARDVTDWDATVVEFFRHLATTQYLNHLRPGNRAWANLRDEVVLEGLGTPFDQLAHTVDVRRMASGRGRYNITNIGLFLWTLGARSVTRAQAYRVDDFRYTFDPLGRNVRLVTRPEVEQDITHVATELNVPLPIGRRRLDRDLPSYYGASQVGEEGADGRALSILLRVNGADVLPPRNAAGEPIGTVRDLIRVCDLSDLKDDLGQVTGWAHTSQGSIAIDPVLGRIAFPADRPAPSQVQVSFQRGFSIDMGGGEYPRADGFDADPPVLTQLAAGTAPLALQDAIDALQATGGVVELSDNGYYYAEGLNVNVAAGKSITLRAADKHRPVLVLGGDLTVVGGPTSAFTLDGLLIAGGRLNLPRQTGNGTNTVANQIQTVRLRHCTLVPTSTPAFQLGVTTVPAQGAQARVVADVPGLELTLSHTISGALRVDNECSTLLTNSIVDALAPTAMAYAGIDGSAAGGALQAINTTLVGRVHAHVVKLASNTLFHARPAVPGTPPVQAAQISSGCLRYCYVPPGSVLPRPYSCQPGPDGDGAPVEPVFTSLDYGDAAYCQLETRTAGEIREGADDGAEIGAFHDLYKPQRLATLRVRLTEFLRFGLEAGVVLEN